MPHVILSSTETVKGEVTKEERDKSRRQDDGGSPPRQGEVKDASASHLELERWLDDGGALSAYD